GQIRPRGQTIASNSRRQRSSSSNAAIMSPTVVIPARISRTPLAMTASRCNGSDHCGEPAKVQGLLSLVDKGGVAWLTTDASVTGVWSTLLVRNPVAGVLLL